MVKSKRKDYITYISLNSVDKILNLAVENNSVFDCYKGSLLDNYIIFDTDNIRIWKGKKVSRKYIILIEEYKNPWSSITKMIMTDSEETVKKYEEIFTENI